MGSAASCMSPNESEPGGSGTVINEDTNPFITNFSKKERQLLRDTWTQISDAKQVISEILVDLIDNTPELKPVFGVKRVPKVAMLQMPKMGAHVGHFLTFLDQITSFLGFTDNCLGAWQTVRKLGRSHAAKVEFLRRGHAEEEGHYFHMFAEVLHRKLLPYLTGEVHTASSDDANKGSFLNLRQLLKHLSKFSSKKEKVRFNVNYQEPQVRAVWERFWKVVVNELRESLLFEAKKLRKQSAASIMVPQQEKEQQERKNKKRKKDEMEKLKNPADRPEEQRDKMLQAMSGSSGIESCSDSDDE